MSEVEITARVKVGDDLREATIFKDLGDDCPDAIDKFGDTVVFTNYRASAKITAQSAIRRYLKAGKSPEEIVKLMEAWKPGVAIERISDPVAAFKAKFASKSPEEQAAILEELKASLAA